MSRITTQEIFEQLSRRHAGDASQTIELVEGVNPAINLTLHDQGDMEIQIAAAGDQVFISTVLAPAELVKDRHAFNEVCMRLNPQYPLSNMGITQLDGRDIYIVFGQLSSTSTVDQIDEEIAALAENTIAAAESLEPYFN